MEVKVCRNCKKMFQYTTGPVLCPKCKQLEEEMFLKVKDYLRENPGSNMSDVSQATNVSATLIEKFLKQGRLQVSQDSPIKLTCDKCGKKITTGKFCDSCKKEILEGLSEVKHSMVEQQAKEVQREAKMRFLQSDKLGH